MAISKDGELRVSSTIAILVLQTKAQVGGKKSALLERIVLFGKRQFSESGD